MCNKPRPAMADYLTDEIARMISAKLKEQFSEDCVVTLMVEGDLYETPLSNGVAMFPANNEISCVRIDIKTYA